MPEETFCRLFESALSFLLSVLSVFTAGILFLTTIAIKTASLTVIYGVVTKIIA